jgi:L-lactate dehydrogenase complex protein LldF
MEPTSHSFPANARAGLADPVLQTALGLARTGFPLRRAQAIARLPEFEELREQGRAIKDHTLTNLDFYLERYEQNVIAGGGHVHWARDAAEARVVILDICAAGAKTVTGQVDGRRGDRLNDHLEPTASPRSRPISANTSSSCATSRRATSLRWRSI